MAAHSSIEDGKTYKRLNKHEVDLRALFKGERNRIVEKSTYIAYACPDEKRLFFSFVEPIFYF